MLSRDTVARRVANLHFRIEPGIKRIFRLMAPAESDDGSDLLEPVKLLEVNDDTIPCGIVPVYFRSRPERSIDFPSVIIEITPDEFQQIGKDLTLPDGWRLAEEIERAELVQDHD